MEPKAYFLGGRLPILTQSFMFQNARLHIAVCFKLVQNKISDTPKETLS